jgi:hypothetical protein
MLKSVQFSENLPISKVRKEADAHLAKRIKESFFLLFTICVGDVK